MGMPHWALHIGTARWIKQLRGPHRWRIGDSRSGGASGPSGVSVAAPFSCRGGAVASTAGIAGATPPSSPQLALRWLYAQVQVAHQAPSSRLLCRVRMRCEAKRRSYVVQSMVILESRRSVGHIGCYAACVSSLSLSLFLSLSPGYSMWLRGFIALDQPKATRAGNLSIQEAS